MEIEVKIDAGSTGRISKKMEIDENTRIQDILSRLKITEGMPKVIFVNGVHVPEKGEQILKEGDVVTIIPPLAGG